MRHTYHTGPVGDPRPHGSEQVVGGARRDRKRHHVERKSLAARDEPPRFEATDVLVVGGEHFVSRLELEPVRYEVHRLGRVPGEDEPFGIPTQQRG